MVVARSVLHCQVVERQVNRSHPCSTSSGDHNQDGSDFECIYATSGRRREQGQGHGELEAGTLERLKMACGAMKLGGSGGELMPNIKLASHWEVYPNLNVPASPTIKEFDSKDSFPLLCILASSLSEDKLPPSPSKPAASEQEGKSNKMERDSKPSTGKEEDEPSTAEVAAPIPRQPGAIPPTIPKHMPSLSRTSTATSTSSSIPATPTEPLTPSIPQVAVPSKLQPAPPGPPVSELHILYTTKPLSQPASLPPTLVPSPSHPLSLKAQQCLAQSHIDAVLASYDEAQVHIDSVIRKYEMRRQEGLVRLMASREDVSPKI
ncbi:hypothetical protein NEOLEDRAFT_1136793 [Neolentinus lepideus HHB14362 ss-1]|uniref:Uncharacterized protein n=1 Tax=Neolentinus lepideus HHB14362 ss-1 TaxID=1314782 RepID=A0A165R1F2_9AGAM|nr:hypothetical protein NEOLEDRAFT_1136793 [Neolentinus lepideus HHB14362 ss-1]